MGYKAVANNSPGVNVYTQNYGYNNGYPNNGYGGQTQTTYASGWNNAPNLFASGAFGGSAYGGSPYGNNPTMNFNTGYGSYGSYPNPAYDAVYPTGGLDYGNAGGPPPVPGITQYCETPGDTTPTPGDTTPNPGDTTPTPDDTTPTPGDTTPTPPVGSPSGGTGSAYVDNMMEALKKNGAGPELLAAYMKQYEALGMVPAGTPVPGGGDDSSTIPADGTPPGGGSTPVSGTSGVTPTPPAGGPTPSGPPAAVGPSGQGGAESPEFANAKPIDWDKAPAALQNLKPQIQAAAKASGTPEVIVAAVIWNESRGNINVQATDGGTDQGLMQIDNTTYDTEVAGKNGLPHGTTPTDKDQNIMAGATYLAALKQKFGTWDLALRAYNSGENGVDKSNPDATPAGTGIGPYVQYARSHITDLENGTLNPNT